MKKIILIFGLAIVLIACGGKSDKSEETAKKDSAEVKDVPKVEDVAKKQETTSDKQQVAIGTFVSIDQGDYAHFIFKPENGEEKNLFVLNTDETFDKISANPDKYKGVKVKVTWEAKKQNIPEAGGEMDIEEYIKAEILK